MTEKELSAAAKHDVPSPVRFGRFAFCPGAGQLSCSGESIPLLAPARALLGHLILNRHRTVARDELLKAVWHDTTVGEGALRLAIWQVRQALGDSGSDQHCVQTVRGRGYRFVASCLVEPAPRMFGSEASALALVGRAQELELLDHSLQLALRSGQTRILMGPPGAGKSHLAREALQRARGRGYLSVWGHAEPGCASPPLGPWLEMLAKCLEETSDVVRTSCAQSAPLACAALRTKDPHSAQASPTSSPEQLRAELFRQLIRCFKIVAAEQPLLLLLEDLQWADEASRAFLIQLTRAAANSPMLLLVTCRSFVPREERELARALDVVLREPHGQQLELRGLSVDDTAAILRSVSSTSPAQLAHHVHALAHGNPLLTLELARLRVLAAGDTQRDLLTGDSPEVQAIIRRRFDALLTETRHVLHASAVLAPEFHLSELAAMLQQSPETTLEHLQSCLQHGLIAEAERGRLRFTHPLIRGVAYDGLSLRERAELHRLAGDWLEQKGLASSPGALARLADHYYQASRLGESSKAVAYARLCAEAAVRNTAYTSAITYYDRALECIELMPGPNIALRIELEIERAIALRASGASGQKTNDVLAELAQRAHVHGKPDLLARAALAYSGQGLTAFLPTHVVGTVDARQLTLLETALAALSGEPSQHRVLLLCSLAYALVGSADGARRVALCEESVALARAMNVPWLLARALLFKAYACAAPDAHSQRLATCNELVELTQRSGLTELEIEARMTRAVCLLEVGETEQAAHDENHAILLSQGSRQPRLRVRVELLELFRAFSEGDLDRAQLLAQHCYDANQGNPIASALFVVRNASMQMLRTGPTPDMLALHESLVSSFPEGMAFRCSLASAYAAFRRTESAQQQFDWVARDGFSTLPKDINWLTAMALLADTAIWLDDARRARLVYEQLAPFASRWPFFAGEAVPGGPTAHWLAELATTFGDFHLASHWLKCARTLCEKLRAPLFIQYNALAEARLLLLWRPGDPGRASWLLRDVVAFAERRGIVWLRLCALSLQQDLERAREDRTRSTGRAPQLN